MDEFKIIFTPDERDLIVDHTFTEPDLTERLRVAEIKGKYLIANYSADDLEELIGFIAAEANHTDDRELQKKPDQLFDKLERILEKK